MDSMVIIMRYYKQIEDNYIVCIGTGSGGTEITEEEYDNIMSIIQSAPHEDGKGYRLKTDLSWEEHGVEPIEVEEEPSAEEILSIITGEQE